MDAEIPRQDERLEDAITKKRVLVAVVAANDDGVDDVAAYDQSPVEQRAGVMVKEMTTDHEEMLVDL